MAKFGIAILFLRFEVIYKRKVLTSTAFEEKGIFVPFCMQFFLQKSLAIFKCAEFEQSGLQKYEQPTKVFCLIENLSEYFSEIKL